MTTKRVMTRRDFLSKGPLVILAFLCMPGYMLRWLAKPQGPNLRQIGFAIKENLGFMVFNPSAVQKLNRVTVPTFEIASCPSIRIDDIKNRRFDVAARSERIYTLTRT